MSDIDTAAVDSLKVLDPKRPIREADIKALRICANSGLSNSSFDRPSRSAALHAKIGVEPKHASRIASVHTLGLAQPRVDEEADYFSDRAKPIGTGSPFGTG